MGILDKLLGRKPMTGAAFHGGLPGQATLAPIETDGPQFLHINNEFYEVAYSPNRQFTLGWSDATPDGRIAGHRGGGKGSWILLEGDRERSRGRLERPNDGRVANNGRFVLVDWLFTDKLAGAFYAFDSDGTVLIVEDLGANPGQTAIAPDGRMAVVETLHNPSNAEWSNMGDRN